MGGLDRHAMKKQISAALLVCAGGAVWAAPPGYVEVFEAFNGMKSFMHPDVRTMSLSMESGRLPLKLALADEWVEQGKESYGIKKAYRCDSPSSSFLVLPARDGRLFRFERPHNAMRGTLGYAMWDFACAHVRDTTVSPAQGIPTR